MTAPLAAFLAANLGPPMLPRRPALYGMGDDDLAALAADELYGWGPMRRGGGGAMMQRWRQMQAQRLAQRCQAAGYSRGGGGEFGADDLSMMLGADDMTDLADDAEVSGDEDEIGDLEGDDPLLMGADGGEELGATITQLDNRVSRLTSKLQILEMKLNSTPPYKIRKRARLTRAIARVRMAIKTKEAKRQMKAEILASKLGLPPAAAAAIAAGGGAAAGVAAAYGLRPSEVARAQQQLAQGAVANALGRRMDSIVSQDAGEELRIPFTDASTGSPVTVIQVVAGAGLRTATISMETDPITFADFEIIGIDTDLKVKQALGNGTAGGEALVNVLLASVVPNGGLNLLYQTQNVAFGAQTVANTLSMARTIQGIRVKQRLNRNNTATLSATFRQEATTTLTIDATFQAALVCRRITDDNVRMAS